MPRHATNNYAQYHPDIPSHFYVGINCGWALPLQNYLTLLYKLSALITITLGLFMQLRGQRSNWFRGRGRGRTWKKAKALTCTHPSIPPLTSYTHAGSANKVRSPAKEADACVTCTYGGSPQPSVGRVFRRVPGTSLHPLLVYFIWSCAQKRRPISTVSTHDGHAGPWPGTTRNIGAPC